LLVTTWAASSDLAVALAALAGAVALEAAGVALDAAFAFGLSCVSVSGLIGIGLQSVV
jgi:hypothetical protein